MQEPSPSTPEPTRESTRDMADAVFWIVLSVVATLGGMAFFYYYPWPVGRPPTLGEFVMFFFREILLLGILVLGLAAMAISRLAQALRNRGSRHAL